MHPISGQTKLAVQMRSWRPSTKHVTPVEDAKSVVQEVQKTMPVSNAGNTAPSAETHLLTAGSSKQKGAPSLESCSRLQPLIFSFLLDRRVKRYQKHISSIEAAWKRFLPNVELSLAIHSIETEHQIPGSAQVNPSVAQAENQSALLWPEASSIDTLASPNKAPIDLDSRTGAGLDLDLERADTLEWDESSDLAFTADGIGSLSLDQKGTGYMGPQSGNALLKTLQKSSMLLRTSRALDLPQTSPGPQVSERTINSSTFRDECVGYYFQYFNSAYPILHEGYFRAQYSGALPKPKDGSWPLLLNIVLAIGAYSSEISNQNADIHFAQEFFRNLSLSVLQRGSLHIVQALTLAANYLQKRNKPNSGFTFLGIAMNMAQGIGLHREFAESSISTFTMEIRRRVWWTLFIFDSGARLTFGRPTLGLAGVTTRLPRNLDDKDLSVDLDELPPSKDHATVTSSLIWQTKLAQLSNVANEILLEAGIPQLSTMTNLEKRILMWRENLPSYMQAEFCDPEYDVFTVPRMVLLWRSMHLRIVIHRPFVLDQIKRKLSFDLRDSNTGYSRCIDAARECILSIVNFWTNTSSRHGALVWYALYWLVTATFVPVTCLLYDPQHPAGPSWRQLVEMSKKALDGFGAFEPTAIRAAQIIDDIMDLVPSSPDSTTFALNEPVRLEFVEMWNQSWADIVIPEESSTLDYLM